MQEMTFNKDAYIATHYRVSEDKSSKVENSKWDNIAKQSKNHSSFGHRTDRNVKVNLGTETD